MAELENGKMDLQSYPSGRTALLRLTHSMSVRLLPHSVLAVDNLICQKQCPPAMREAGRFFLFSQVFIGLV